MRDLNKQVQIGERVFMCDDVLFDEKVLNGSDEENISFLLDGGWVEVEG